MVKTPSAAENKSRYSFFISGISGRVLTGGVGLILAALLGACQKDPYEAKRDSIRKAQVPAPEKTSLTVDENNLIIDTSLDSQQLDFAEVVEGEKVELRISGRVLFPNAKGVISIDNLEAFEKATFNETNGLFSWTPEQGYVGDELERVAILVARIVTPRAGERPALTRERRIPIRVRKILQEPVIESVSGLPKATVLLESSETNLRFQVRDFSPTSSLNPPFLMFRVTKGDSSGAPVDFLVDPKNVKQDDKERSLWTIEGKVVLGTGFKDRPSMAEKEVSFMVASSMGKTSKPVTVQFYSKPRLLEARMDLTSNVIRAKSGEAVSKNIRFWVPDDRFEIDLPDLQAQTSFEKFPEPPLWTCGYVLNPNTLRGRDLSQVSCVLSFTAPEGITKSDIYIIKVAPKVSRGNGDPTDTLSTSYTIQVEVEP